MASEDKRDKTQRETENNANNIRNAADVAIATKNPYAAAAGAAVKVADKFSGGRSTKALGKMMTKANKISPGGRKIQGLSNRLNESGASDKIGKAAAAKNGMSGGSGAGSAAKGASAGKTPGAAQSAASSSTDSRKPFFDFGGSSDENTEDAGDFKLFKKKDGIPLGLKIKIIGIILGFLFFIIVIASPMIVIVGGIFKGNSSNKSITVGSSSIVVVDKDGNEVDVPDDADPDVFDISYYITVGESAIFWWPIASDDSNNPGGTPVSTVITSQFGNRADPFSGQVKYHSGIDIAPTSGSDVNIIAAASGEVIYPGSGNPVSCPSSSSESDCGGGYGNYVMIRHDNGIVTLYGHLYENSITVRSGDRVSQGQVIAKMGSSGRSTGTHLHFEVRVNGMRVDPLGFVSIDNPRPSDEYIVSTGSDNTQTICYSLRRNNFSEIAVAAILGNIERESNYDPNAVNSLGCIGIVQWCSGRANNLKNTYGSDWNNINNQLEFMFSELNGNESAVLTYLNDPSITSAGLMAEKFCSVYERPEDGECDNGKRQTFAENKYAYVVNGCQ